MVNKDTDLKVALAKAQSTRSLENIFLTVTSNVVIALSLSLLLYFEDGGTLIFLWLGAAVTFALFRAWLVWRMKSAGLAESDPRRVLRTLTVLALVSGLLWCVVPLGFGAFSNKQNIDYIAFIMAGTTTGAIIQSLAYSPIALAFGAPLMGATLYRMISSGSGSGYIIAIDAIFLTLMLFRAARLGERGFIASQTKAFEAISLAESLAEANREVLNSYAAMERLARTDSLTGLSNRSHFQSFGDTACHSGKSVAFVLFDIDNFKSINDTRGHDTGDRVIRAVAEVLQSACHADDLPVRLGGDEFVVVLQGDDVANRSLVLANRLMAALRLPLTIGSHALSISCSIGVAVQTDSKINVDDLLARADVALYRAKDDGRACARVFDEQMQSELALQRCIDLDLPQALAQGELYLEFQPQVTMATLEVVGFEALLRWRHPRAGMIPPPNIIDAAVRLRLSGQITAFVGEHACEFLCALDRRQAPSVKVAVNVSPREFSMHSPASILKDITDKYGIDPRRIEIEITEEALFDPKHCVRELRRIDEYGFGLAIDDFGVGHSSISNLMTVELDTVKIDRSFVHGITASHQNQQLVAAIITVSQALGHKIVAEGVETEEDAESLRMLGCSCGQGWLYGRPMAAIEAIEWLSRSVHSESPSITPSMSDTVTCRSP